MSDIMHIGRVVKLSHNRITVMLTDVNACESCHLKGNCFSGNVKSNLVEIAVELKNYEINEMVNVFLTQKKGIFAVFVAYVLPFFILISGLFFLSQFFNEGISAIIIIGVLVLYYVLLYFLNPLMDSKLSLQIEKINKVIFKSN